MLEVASGRQSSRHEGCKTHPAGPGIEELFAIHNNITLWLCRLRRRTGFK